MAHFTSALGKLQQYKNAHNPPGSLSSADKNKLPPLHQHQSAPSSVGLQGNALTIRQLSTSKQSEEPRSVRRSQHDLLVSRELVAGDAVVSPDSVITQTPNKTSSAEAELNKKIKELESLVAKLRHQLKDCELSKDDLQKQLRLQEEKYNSLVRTHQEALTTSQHNSDKLASELSEAKNDTQLQLALKEISELKLALEKAREDFVKSQQKHDTDAANMKALYEDKLKTLQQSKDQELSASEEKLTKLKRQMADNLMGNSKERQQQIDDLMKEMQKMQEEEKTLKQRLKSLQSASDKGECANCSVLSAKLRSVEKELDNKRN